MRNRKAMILLNALTELSSLGVVFSKDFNGRILEMTPEELVCILASPDEAMECLRILAVASGMEKRIARESQAS